MPGGKAYKPPVSKAQARLFGAAAGGQIKGFDPAEARNKLRGVKTSKLPASTTKRSKGGKGKVRQGR
jgi:hypothetical protein